MDVVKYAALILVCTVLFALIKRIHPEFASVFLIGCVLLLSVNLLSAAGNLIHDITDLTEDLRIMGGILPIVLKCTGIAFVSEITSEICKDSGSLALGEKIIWGGKIIIMLELIPVIKMIFESIKDLLAYAF